jgi:tryptophan-rich sensory protein
MESIMAGIATPGQLRMSFLRWVLVLVPLIVLLGILASGIAGPNTGGWYEALERPALEPPGYIFGIAWTLFYGLMGVALAIVIHARGSYWRRTAIIVFWAHLLANLLWSPIFFGMHQVSFALFWLIVVLAMAIATTLLFGRVRPLAAWLMVPYLVWLCFAALLNLEIDQKNPDAETLVVGATSTQI